LKKLLIPELGKISCSIDKIINNYVNEEQLFDEVHFIEKIKPEEISKETKLTNLGVKRFLYCIKGKYWQNKRVFLDYLDRTEKEHLEILKNIFGDESNLRDIDYLNRLNLDEIVKRDISKEKYFETITKDNHKSIPFLIKEENSILDFIVLDRHFKLEKDINYHAYMNEMISDGSVLLKGYRIMSIEEINNQINKY
jgi:hypothetical protein